MMIADQGAGNRSSSQTREANDEGGLAEICANL
jgi:hypothetical protein